MRHNKRLLNSLYFFNLIFLLSKVFLAGKGFNSFGDELRYYQSARFIKGVLSFDYFQAVDSMFSSSGRPFAVLLGAVPSSLQYLSSIFNQHEIYSSGNSYSLFFYNLFIYSLILWFIYKLSDIFFRNRIISLITVLVYQSFINSFLYLRHAIPYDISLLIFLITIYLITSQGNHLKNASATGKAFFFGVISYVAFLTYPAFFQLFFITFFIFFFSRKNLKQAISYISGSTLVLVLIELLSRTVNKSFIMESLRLGTSANKQGSFDESHLFLFQYLFEVESILGATVVISIVYTLYYFCTADRREFVGSLNIYRLFFLSSFFVIVLYVLSSYYQKSILLSGRFIHQFFPFFALSIGFCFFRLLRSEKKLYGALFALLLTSSFHSVSAIKGLMDISYIDDIAWSLGEKYNFENYDSFCELGNNKRSKLESNIPLFRKVRKNTEYKKLVFVNSCLMIVEKRGVPELTPYISDSDSQALVLEKPHFKNFPAYLFEGDFRELRELWKKHSFTIRVYERFN